MTSKNMFLCLLALSFTACNVDTNTECRFEGAECPNVQHYLRDYQIEVHYDTVWIYDADRLVGKYINTKWDGQIDSILINDNL